MIALDSESGEQHVIIQRYTESNYLEFNKEPPIPMSATIFRFEQENFKSCLKIITKNYKKIFHLDHLIKADSNC